MPERGGSQQLKPPVIIHHVNAGDACLGIAVDPDARSCAQSRGKIAQFVSNEIATAVIRLHQCRA